MVQARREGERCSCNMRCMPLWLYDNRAWQRRFQVAACPSVYQCLHSVHHKRCCAAAAGPAMVFPCFLYERGAMLFERGADAINGTIVLPCAASLPLCLVSSVPCFLYERGADAVLHAAGDLQLGVVPEW